MNIFKLFVVGLMFASANAGCQPSNERTECPTSAWAAPSGISSSDPKYQCACKDASGKYNALCSPGQTCSSSGTCSGTPTNPGSGSGSQCTSATCMAGNNNPTQCTALQSSGCVYVGTTCQCSGSSPAPGPSSSCTLTQCQNLDSITCAMPTNPCVWNGSICGCP